MIRLGVDAWNLPGDRRGIGRYLRSILREWWNGAGDRVEVTLIVPEWHTWTVRGRYLRELDGREYRVVSRALHGRAGLDALWFPFNGCSWTNFSLAATATLHDASNFVVPDYAPQTQAIFHAAAQKCRALITDSHFAQAELARVLGIAPERLVPIALGVDPPRALRPVSPEVAALRPFVLYVGAPEWRKGFDTLLAAMREVRRARPDLRAAVTARLEGSAFAAASREVGGVVELGHVDEALLAELYRECALLAFPSRYEGFGLPVLEAMSYGAPVVASNASAVPEAGGDAACYVSPGDAQELATAILRVAGDEAYAADLRQRGLVRAARFTWERTAEQTLTTIEATL
jgi:glycosyltransferase involved in cell wall biosynthesis